MTRSEPRRRAPDQERRSRRRSPEPVDEPEVDDVEESEREELDEDEFLDEDEPEELDEEELADPDPDPDPEDVDEPEPPKRIPARRIARFAAEQVMEMTGRETESVTSVQRSDEGWMVGLEVVESRRVPDTADLMAIYEAEMDGDGELLSYRRLRQYTRGKGDRE